MKTIVNQSQENHEETYFLKRISGRIMTFILLFSFAGLPSFAHCDSYDGPVIKDALKALESNNVSLVIKWIDKKQEAEIFALFNKTYNLRKGDKQIYVIVEKHFLETLVRLHRETEGAPFTGLKPAGSTKEIIKMSDHAIVAGNVDDLLVQLNNHVNHAILEKYQKVAELSKINNTSPEKGREYVKAYIDFTHTLEAIHDIIDHEGTTASKHEH